MLADSAQQGGARDPRLPGMLLLFLAISLPISASLGFLIDDLSHAHEAATSSWFDALVGRTLLLTPPLTHPYLHPIWKLATAWMPASPHVLVRGVALGLHAGNAYLVWRLFDGPRVPRRGLAAAALFLIYRPGMEAVLWAGAMFEVVMLSFALLALLCWRRGERDPRYRWLAVPLAALASLWKISAVGLPVVLAAATLWSEGPAARERGLRRLRAVRPVVAPLLVLCALEALLAFAALERAGGGGPAVSDPGPAATLGALGFALARLFTLIDLGHLWSAPVAGLAVLGFAVAGLFVLPPRARLGLLWALAFLAPPILARGLGQARYAYPAGVGVLLMLSAAHAALATRGIAWRRAAAAALAVWAMAQGALLVRDVRNTARCGALNQEVRALVGARAAMIRDAAGVVVVRRPSVLRTTDLLAYDLGLALPVHHAESCATHPALPCLVFPRRVAVASQCPSPAERPFAELRAPGV